MAETPYDDLPLPKENSEVASKKRRSYENVSSSELGCKEGETVGGKRQKLEKEATVVFALDKIHRALKVDPTFVKLTKATSLLHKLIDNGVTNYTSEERERLLGCLEKAFQVFVALDVSFGLHPALASAFSKLFDSVTCVDAKGYSLEKCANLGATVIKIERADESFAFAKLMRFALEGFLLDLKEDNLKPQTQASASKTKMRVVLRGLYINIVAKGKTDLGRVFGSLFIQSNILPEALKKRRRYQWAKQPTDQYFTVRTASTLIHQEHFIA